MLIAGTPWPGQDGGVFALFLVVLGIAGLAIGSGYVVRGALAIAQRLGLSPLVVGLTITSIGTSLPEIATNIAVGADILSGVPASGIAVGNVIGSCLSQITLLLAVAGLVGTLTCPRRSLRRDGAMLVIALLAMFACSIDGTISRFEGGLLVSAYAVYLVVVVVLERQWADVDAQEPAGDDLSLGRAVGLLAIGLVIVTASADLAVENAVAVARAMGVGASLIGLGVRFGTGLPELTVSLRAMNAQSGTLGLGNLIGSNITDPLLSAGLGALVAPMLVPPVAIFFDFPFWMAASGVALLLLFNHLDLNRRESGVLLIVFGLFVWVRATLLPV